MAAPVTGDVERGRAAYADWAWRDAYESLSRAEESAPLAPEDLELLGVSAYMLGDEEEWMEVFERALDRRAGPRRGQ